MSLTQPAKIAIPEIFQQAIDRHAAGDMEGAERGFRAVVAAAPDHFEAMHMLGVVAAQRGRLDEAAALLSRAVVLNPRATKAWINRAGVLQALGRNADALKNCDNALAIDPGMAPAHRNRAAILKSMGSLEAALSSCDRALAIDPASAETHNLRGAVIQDLMRFDEALASYDRALVLQPDFAEAHSNRGGVLNVMLRHADALAACDRAVAIKPTLADALYNRGIAMAALGRHDGAVASYSRALTINPDFPKALYNRAGEYAYLLRHHDAAADLERALALDPQLDFARGMLLQARMHCCDWRAFAGQTAQVIADVQAGRRVSDPLAFLGVSDQPADQLRCARTWVDVWNRPSATPVWSGDRYHHDRIRVAYLSPDFRDHAVAFLSAGLFARHDRAQFETIAISFGPDTKDATRLRMERSFDRFIDVRTQSDHEIAALLRELEVDIAVDLCGFTGGARTGVFALRPAPVQVNFLGYTGTMGASYIDYIVADHVVIPEAHDKHYSERVVRLPDSFQVNDAERVIAAATPARGALGLPENAFVFCCFNNAFKITPPVFARWMRLLQQVEGSVLWLLEGNAEVPVNLRRHAAMHGIAPERLVFAPKLAPADHLARHRCADLFLDTLPYNAHTTASDALWAGLPVLTLPGDSFAGRVAASLLHAAGLPQLIATSVADYEALAVRMATDGAWRQEIRDQLAHTRGSCALFDTDRFRRHLEIAYRHMWSRAEAGDPPAAFAVQR